MAFRSSLFRARNTYPTSSRAFGYQPVLTADSLPQRVIDTEYAVRGRIAIRASEITRELEAGKKYPFTTLTKCNIGNPQAMGQPILSFPRDVMSLMLSPWQIEGAPVSNDAKERARRYLSLTPAGAVGAYTAESPGARYIKQSVKEFIEERDSVEVDVENIYLTNGASEGVRIAMNLIIGAPNHGVMIPIPQYPLYSATITMTQGAMVNYYLDEAKGWALDVSELERSYAEACDRGVDVKSLVVINPGNPTGQVLREQNLEEIIRFAYERRLVLLADEVYQENIYIDRPWMSLRRKLAQMGAPYSDAVELFSFHSCSKGLHGECGLRGGYMEVHNVHPDVLAQVYKMKSIELCSNTIGQASMALKVDPPRRGREADATVDAYEREHSLIFDSLKARATALSRRLNQMKNVSSQEVEGAMYAFPTLKLAPSAVKEAEKLGMAPDMLYCLEALEKTGIMLVPGSGFGQVEGTHHFRITNLVYPEENLERALDVLADFNDKFHARFT